MVSLENLFLLNLVHSKPPHIRLAYRTRTHTPESDTNLRRQAEPQTLNAPKPKVKKEEIFKRNHSVSLKLLFWVLFCQRKKVPRFSETSKACRRLII